MSFNCIESKKIKNNGNEYFLNVYESEDNSLRALIFKGDKYLNFIELSNDTVNAITSTGLSPQNELIDLMEKEVKSNKI